MVFLDGVVEGIDKNIDLEFRKKVRVRDIEIGVIVIKMWVYFSIVDEIFLERL